ncbi:hypothetical protein Tsubulata_021463 [Turnera subulata]|uniref:Uncharacterized protein n=1 Tax=Turnera subulata TaxID=218843 RepID=A0A9Q0FWQ3_9ROSI|nr:hypothetical protein Tsubulata_021463 [Turnera subulata]
MFLLGAVAGIEQNLLLFFAFWALKESSEKMIYYVYPQKNWKKKRDTELGGLNTCIVQHTGKEAFHTGYAAGDLGI